jgi:hypothetical protein
MKILLPFFAIAGALCAQSPVPNVATNGWRAVVDSMVARQAFQVGNTGARLTPSAAVPTSPCAVPLIEMHIPNDVHFTMQTIAPPTNTIDHMPVAVPAPSCADPAK